LKKNSNHILFIITIVTLAFPVDKKCNICYHSINNDYLKDLWGNIYHPEHKKDAQFCESCYRIISVAITDGGYIMPDERLICKLCYSSSIIDRKQADSNIMFVSDFLSENGIKINNNIYNINLIYKNEIKFNNDNSMHYKGFTILESKNKSQVSNIFILKGMPEQEFNAILGHELMHIWISNNNLDIDEDLEEYYCNLVSKNIYKLDNSQFSNVKIEGINKVLNGNNARHLFNETDYNISQIIKHIYNNQ